MQKVDFDFGRYIAIRKGSEKAQRREGEKYAFRADLRLIRRMERLGPVPTVLEETSRLFQRQAQQGLLDNSVFATLETYPVIAKAAIFCAERLHIKVPPVFVTDALKDLIPVTLGVLENPFVLFPRLLVETLSEDELRFVLGAEFGRIQNGHSALRTALFYISSYPTGLLRFAVIPAKSILSVWLRRANITADRAGLLCVRDIDIARQAQKKMLSAQNVGDYTERETALLRFSGSQYYRMILGFPDGETQENCDEAVATLLDKRKD